MLKHATGMFLNARTTLGLPRRIGIVNTKPRLQSRGFFLLKSVHRTLFKRQDPARGLPSQRFGRNTWPVKSIGIENT